MVDSRLHWIGPPGLGHQLTATCVAVCTANGVGHGEGLDRLGGEARRVLGRRGRRHATRGEADPGPDRRSLAAVGDRADPGAERGAAEHLLGARPLLALRHDRLGLDLEHAAADLEVGERHAERRLALHLVALVDAHDLAEDAAAVPGDQPAGGREVVVEEALEAIADPGIRRADRGRHAHEHQRSRGHAQRLRSRCGTPVRRRAGPRQERRPGLRPRPAAAAGRRRRTAPCRRAPGSERRTPRRPRNTAC